MATTMTSERSSVLVVGATGLLGSEICSLLQQQGQNVRALVRPTSAPDKIERLKDIDAKTVLGDLKDQASLDAACEGIATVISTASSTLNRQPGDDIESVDRNGQINLINAAANAGVTHFILVSFPEMPEDFPLQEAKRSAEKTLRESGMVFTILHPTFFTEVWLSPALGFDVLTGSARIYGTGDQKISWISYRDVAKFAVAAVSNPSMLNRVIELGGPAVLSPFEVITIFEKLTGKKIQVDIVPESILRKQKSDASDPLQKSFAGLMLGYAAGQEIDMDSTLRSIPMDLSSVEDYARSFV